MDLQYSEEQQLIARQAREFFERECPLEAVRDCWTKGGVLAQPLWGRMAELGWLGAMLPERFGGMALSHTDFTRIAEEAGRGLLPAPLLGTVAAAQAIVLAGGEAVQEEVLPGVAAGDCRLALVRHGEGGRVNRLGGRFHAVPDGDGVRLYGEKLAVPGLAEADRLVVAAVPGKPRPGQGEAGQTIQAGDGVAYYVVDPKAEGVEIAPLEALEGGWPQGGLRLSGVAVPAAHCLTAGPPADGDGVDTAARVDAQLELALAFDALGGAQRLLELTVEYAGLRTAFGHPIGTYQAVKHKCADVLYAVENLRIVGQWAGWVLDVPRAESGTEPAAATAVARAAAIEAYDLAVRNSTQVHGAIGVTEEHDLHLFAKRSKTLGLAFGSLAFHQERILADHGFGAA